MKARFAAPLALLIGLPLSCVDGQPECQNTFDCDIGESCVDSVCVVVTPEDLAIEFFRADTTNITVGSNVELSWSVDNAERCTINDDTVACSGVAPYSPLTTTTYTLRGENGATSVFQDIEITVNPLDAGSTDGGEDGGADDDAGLDAGPNDDAGIDAGPTDGGADDDAGLDAGPDEDAGIDAGPTDSGTDVDAGLDAGFDAGPVFSITNATAHVVDVTTPELAWSAEGATSCTLDGVSTGLGGGVLVDPPVATGPRSHTIACVDSGGTEVTTTVTVWWGDAVFNDLTALLSSGSTTITGNLILDSASNSALVRSRLVNIVEVKGNILFAETNFENFTMDTVKVGKSIQIQENSALIDVTFPVLTKVGEGLSFALNPLITNITVEALVDVGGIYIAFNDTLPCAVVEALRDALPTSGTVTITPNAGVCE